MSDAHQRENTEPTEQDRTIPLSIWVVVGILTVWGVGFYVMSADDAIEPILAKTTEAAPQIVAVAAKTDKAETSKVTTPAAKSVSSQTEASTASQAATETKPEVAAIDGSSIYATQCQACHQGGGVGIPGVFPPLKNAEWVVGDPKVLAGIILAGYTGSLEVLGTTYNGAMPAFADKLNDAEAAALLTYLRTDLNKESAVDASVIADVRSKIPSSPYTNINDLKAIAKP